MLKLLIARSLPGVGLIALVRAIEPRFAFFPSAGERPQPDEAGLAFEAVTLDTADGEHLRGWFLPAVNPRALVLYFHGNGGNLSVWLPILAGVRRQGFS